MAHYLATIYYSDGEIGTMETRQLGYRAAKEYLLQNLALKTRTRCVISIAIDRMDGTLDSPTLTINLA